VNNFLDIKQIFSHGLEELSPLERTCFELMDSTPDFLCEILDLEQENLLALLCDLSGVQDSFRFRCQRRSLKIANYLIDDQGELRKEDLENLLRHLEKTPYIFTSNGYNDIFLCRRWIAFLKKLKESSFFTFFKKFKLPLCHKLAENLVVETLGLPSSSQLTDSHLRRSVLACCLTYLRQNVGSCFATAPAILIQEEQIENFLSDLLELVSTGKLKRTFGGNEYSVPLSPSSGAAEMKKSLSLKQMAAPLWLSPGIFEALQAAEIFPLTLPFNQAIGFQKQLLASFLSSYSSFSLEEWVNQLLLRHFDLTQEEVKRSEKMEKEIVLMSRQIGLKTSSTASLNLIEKVSKYQRAWKKAKGAFRAVTDNALLKAWEFTLASFSEVKMEFSRWNLYVSLGMNPEEKGGIGEQIYFHLEQQLQESNRNLDKYQKEYERSFDELRTVEVLLRRASSESEARRLQAEFQSRLYHMRISQEMRDAAHERSSHYSSFFSFLIQEYNRGFLEYFQEIYDADMQDVSAGQYEDSPAGFRLVYKHGRNDASSWSLIYNEEEWRDYLIDFFLKIESSLSLVCTWEKGIEEIPQITGKITNHIRSEEFLISALMRMAKSHGQALTETSPAALEKIEKKPWAYTSGGTMTTLLKTYYKRDKELTAESRLVDSALDLMIFIIDTLKSLPPSIMNEFLTNPSKGMLMESPTHAFILHPGWDLLKQAWQENLFTYTWARDHFLVPGQTFYSNLNLSSEEQEFLMDECARYFPSFFTRLPQSHSVFHSNMRVKEFRELLLSAIQGTQKKEEVLEEIDAILYQCLPLTSTQEAEKALRHFFPEIISFPSMRGKMMTAKTFKELFKMIFIRLKKSVSLDTDLHALAVETASKWGFSPPPPFLFADTNWSSNYFGFAVNPGTEALELWRMDRTGSVGMPMHSWKKHMKGDKQSRWTIYTHPFEYN